jgi:hypothetical protein
MLSYSMFTGDQNCLSVLRVMKEELPCSRVEEKMRLESGASYFVFIEGDIDEISTSHEVAQLCEERSLSPIWRT